VQVYSWTDELLVLTAHAPCLQKRETRRGASDKGEIFAPRSTRADRRAVADEGQVAAPSPTRARSPRRLRREIGPRAAANEGYVAAPPLTRVRPLAAPPSAKKWELARRDEDIFVKFIN
jgi:hypothetical protein